MQLFLSKEEKTRAELIVTKRNNLVLQDQLLQKEMDSLIAEICKKNSIAAEMVKSLNLEQGIVEVEQQEDKDNSKKEKQI
jgi:hypothetical protein